MIEPKIGEAVIITTEQHDVEIVSRGWTTVESVEVPGSAPVQTIGFVVKLDAQAVFLAQSTSVSKIAGVARVPRSQIMEIAQLRRYTRQNDVQEAPRGAQPLPRATTLPARASVDDLDAVPEMVEDITEPAVVDDPQPLPKEAERAVAGVD